jgi:hypothetical protein
MSSRLPITPDGRLSPITITVVSLLLLALLPGVVSAQATVTRASGGSIRTELSPGFVVNKESSLEREWITIHQELPADLVGTTGVRTVYKSGRSTGEYNYEGQMMVEAKEPLTAITVHYLLFDIWGRHVRTLALTEVSDIAPGRKSFSGTWRAWSETDVATYYASIAYLSRIRTKAGRVISADVTPVLAEAKKFTSKFTAEDLEPRVRPESR